MKNRMVLAAVLLAGPLAFAYQEDVKVCSIGRQGEVYTTEFVAQGSTVAWTQDGDLTNFDIVSVKGASLKRASAVCKEPVVQATHYVLSSTMGPREVEIAVGASGTQYMIFHETGMLVGASSDNCTEEKKSPLPEREI